MTVKISGEQLAQLAAAKDAGDRIAYYSLLSDFGDPYGKLALAVVNSDPGGGATASYFITIQAQIDGNPLTSNELASISLNLMQADYAARLASGGAELGYAQIQDYHQLVFGLAGLTPSAWTANFPLNYLESVEEKQELWATLLNSGSMGSATAIFAALSGGLANQDANVIAYLGKLVSAGVLGLASSSNAFGDYSVSIASGGLAIGGTENNDTKAGSQYADVLMGFDGTDTLTGGSGSDRLYGGAGDDVIVSGNLASGFDPNSISYAALETSSHSEWDDGENDVLVGGEGNDIFIVGGGVNTPNVELTPQQVADRAKLDLIDGADSGFTVYAQWVQDDPGQTQITITAKLTSGYLAAATPFGDLLSFDTALSTVFYPEYNEQYGSSLFGQKVYNAVSKEAILYVESMVNSYTNVLLFGIKNYLVFDPSAGGGALRLAGDDSGGWRIEGDNSDNADLTGSNGDDTVTARGGNDTIDASTYGGGSDWYYGGAGYDTINYVTATQALTISYDSLWGAFSVVGSAGESDYFMDIERIVGGTGNDTISGNNADETFAGGGGNDVITGGAGVNTIDFSINTSSVTVQFSATGQGTAVGAQSGQDTFTQIQNIIGSQGDDTITGDSANNVIDGQGGGDQIDGGGGSDIVSYVNTIASYTFVAASDGYLQVWDYAYTDTIINVETFSFAGIDFLYSAVAAAAASVMSGTASADTITGSSAAEAIFGGAGNDTISGLAGNDLIYGDGGNDVIFAGEGTNNINGGTGSDTLIISGVQTDFTIDIQADRSVLITGSGVSNYVADVEWITFDAPEGQNDSSLDVVYFIEANSSTTATGTNSAETLTGTAGQDTIHGLGGGDTIFGLEGNDVIDAGAGDDVIFAGTGHNIIYGGDGSDTIIIDGAYAGFAISVQDDESILISGAGVLDTISGTEWIVFDAPDGQSDISLGVSNLIEANASTTLVGTASVDSLTGTAGHDTINGLAGNDTIFGLAGDDIIDAGAGDDAIFAGSGTNTVNGGDGSDTVIVDGTYEDFMLQLVNNSQIVIVGENLMNVVSNAEYIVFDAPGTGTDVSINAAQFISENSSQTLNGTSGSDTLTGGAGFDTIHGQAGDDTIYGLGNNDILSGDNGNDTIFGNDGGDLLTGGDGDDFLVGGAGSDTFAFSAAAGQDWIDDFQVGIDKIDISEIGSLNDFSDVLAHTQEWVNGTTWLYADANNYIRLEGVSISSLQATDFIFA
jgi:Ca2+-binding RTX toxin-like protein